MSNLEQFEFEPKYKILYLPNATYWPDSVSYFKSKETAQIYLDFIYVNWKNRKHLYEIIKVE